MLYISRFISSNGNRDLGVVDTDDGSETVLSSLELVQSVSNLGLTVHGLEVFEGHTYTVKPYQCSDIVTPMLSKLSVLHGVNVIVYDSPDGKMISYIELVEGFTQPVTLRLSDFGTCCADWCISGITRIPKTCKNRYPRYITLVLDSSVSITEYSFRGFSPGRIRYIPQYVTIDVREYKKDDVRSIYESFYTGNHKAMDFRIIDSPERRKYMYDVLDYS